MRKMFGKTKRQKKEVMELDITSLLDVLVILLVFLLKSYNASDLKLNLVKNLDMPNSETRKLGNHFVMIQVDENRNIWVDNEKLTIASSSAKNDLLFDRLVELKEADEKLNNRVVASDSESGKTSLRTVNLVFDKSLEYNYIKGVMHTSTLAGYSKFKFIVKGNYN